MSETLFDLPQQDSPRLAWMKRHGITTERIPHWPADEEPWQAWDGSAYASCSDAMAINGDMGVGFGGTEDEAITDYAKKHGILLWNEEAL